MVPIAWVVSLGACVVILDEPTSALSGAEMETPFRAVEQMRAVGIAWLFVSHRVSEICRLCDRVTVRRDGSVARSGLPQELPRPALAHTGAGRAADC
jgi:ribose transport system ATP-binding protein